MKRNKPRMILFALKYFSAQLILAALVYIIFDNPILFDARYFALGFVSIVATLWRSDRFKEDTP